jgi:hypothetical protein
VLRGEPHGKRSRGAVGRRKSAARPAGPARELEVGERRLGAHEAAARRPTRAGDRAGAAGAGMGRHGHGLVRSEARGMAEEAHLMQRELPGERGRRWQGRVGRGEGRYNAVKSRSSLFLSHPHFFSVSLSVSLSPLDCIESLVFTHDYPRVAAEHVEVTPTW